MGRMNDEQLRDALRLYLVLGSVNCLQDPAAVAEEAIRGGATMVQFREKGPLAKRGTAKADLARRIQAVCRRFGVPFIVDDDVELALAVGADGVHIGQEDEPAEVVRQKIGDRIVGLSVHTPEEAELVVKRNVDYIGVGPVYPTKSKEDARAAQGPAVIRGIWKRMMTLPLVGIGGITSERVHDVINSGADGVAVISAITGRRDVRAAAETLFRQVQSALTQSRE